MTIPYLVDTDENSDSFGKYFIGMIALIVVTVILLTIIACLGYKIRLQSSKIVTNVDTNTGEDPEIKDIEQSYSYIVPSVRSAVEDIRPNDDYVIPNELTGN